MKGKSAEQLDAIRKLNARSGAGLLFSYKAWNCFQGDSEKALAYLLSEDFQNSVIRMKNG